MLWTLLSGGGTVSVNVKVIVLTFGKPHRGAVLPPCDVRVLFSTQLFALMCLQAECCLIWSFWSWKKKGNTSHFVFTFSVPLFTHTECVLPIKSTTKPWKASSGTQAVSAAMCYCCSCLTLSRSGGRDQEARTLRRDLRRGTIPHYFHCTQVLQHLQNQL